MTYLEEITRQLSRDEERRNVGYRDSHGIWTIGVGHNVESGPPIPDNAIDLIFESDLKRVVDALALRLPWTVQGLDPVRHGVLVNMAFNLGIDGLLGFKDMLAAIKQGHWQVAYAELLDSKYSKQVGARATRLANQLVTGVWT